VGVLSDERMGLFLYMLLALASVVFLGSESISQIWDFPFRRLLRLAGSRWRYSTPPPYRVVIILVRYRLKSVLCGLDREHLLKPLYFDTSAASVFVTAETTVKVFIPVVMVYYLRLATWTRLIVWDVVDQWKSALIQIFRLLGSTPQYLIIQHFTVARWIYARHINTAHITIVLKSRDQLDGTPEPAATILLLQLKSGIIM
jgi:hypothetical protein